MESIKYGIFRLRLKSFVHDAVFGGSWFLLGLIFSLIAGVMIAVSHPMGIRFAVSMLVVYLIVGGSIIALVSIFSFSNKNRVIRNTQNRLQESNELMKRLNYATDYIYTRCANFDYDDPMRAYYFRQRLGELLKTEWGNFNFSFEAGETACVRGYNQQELKKYKEYASLCQYFYRTTTDDFKKFCNYDKRSIEKKQMRLVKKIFYGLRGYLAALQKAQALLEKDISQMKPMLKELKTKNKKQQTEIVPA